LGDLGSIPGLGGSPGEKVKGHQLGKDYNHSRQKTMKSKLQWE